MYPDCLCGKNEYVVKNFSTKEKDFSIILCVGCGLSRTWPIPLSEEAAGIFYGEQDDYNDRFKRLDLWKKFSLRAIKILKKYKIKGELLDVGCNIGIFVAQAEEYGYNAFGTDISEKAVNFGKEKLNLSQSLYQGTLADLERDGRKFDIISYVHVMEHIEKIEAELDLAKKAMKTDGMLYIEVPNFDSCWRKALKNLWYGFSPRQHIWQFSENSLVNILKNNGLEIIFSTARYSMYHKITFDIKGFAKAVLYFLSFVFNCGDNLIVIAKK